MYKSRISLHIDNISKSFKQKLWLLAPNHEYDTSVCVVSITLMHTQSLYRAASEHILVLYEKHRYKLQNYLDRLEVTK